MVDLHPTGVETKFGDRNRFCFLQRDFWTSPNDCLQNRTVLILRFPLVHVRIPVNEANINDVARRAVGGLG